MITFVSSIFSSTMLSLTTGSQPWHCPPWTEMSEIWAKLLFPSLFQRYLITVVHKPIHPHSTHFQHLLLAAFFHGTQSRVFVDTISHFKTASVYSINWAKLLKDTLPNSLGTNIYCLLKFLIKTQSLQKTLFWFNCPVNSFSIKTFSGQQYLLSW